MKNSVDQQVIDFTATYTGTSSREIHNYTTLSSLGIITQPDLITYVIELEDSFGLKYDEGDESGIVTVGDADHLIEKKLGSNNNA